MKMYPRMTIHEAVNSGKFKLSKEDLTILGNCTCRIGDTVRIRRGKKESRENNAASIIFETLPEDVVKIVSRPDPTPFYFRIVPLSEIIVCLKHNIPNHNDHCRYISFKNGDVMDCRRENIVFTKV